MTTRRALNLSVGTFATMLPILVLIGVALLVVFFVGQRFRLFGRDITLAPTSLANERPGEPRQVSLYTLLPKDGIRSIDDPQFLSPEEAAPDMADQELVIGVSIEGDTRAYPLNVLSRHEIVNDVVGGTPLAVTYCPLCFTGIVYDRRVDGETLEFGVSGKLIMNDLVMYDRQTDSLWQQILGEGIDGRYKGVRLTALPATQTTWSQWLAGHPDTLVLDKNGRYQSDSYNSYYADGSQGVLGGFGEGDDRLPAKALVMGLLVGDQPKAYPFRELERNPLVHDTIDGEELLVVYDDRSGTVVAFDRTVDGQTLTFELERPIPGDLLLRDRETGSIWSGLGGMAQEGPLAGTRLTQLPSFYSFWFAWTDFYTRTDLYQADDGEPS